MLPSLNFLFIRNEYSESFLLEVFFKRMRVVKVGCLVRWHVGEVKKLWRKDILKALDEIDIHYGVLNIKVYSLHVRILYHHNLISGNCGITLPEEKIW